MTDRCHWSGEGPMLKAHIRECRDSGCEGCEPCREDHCTECRRHLRDYERFVCNRCVGEVRDNLDRIAILCELAPLAAAATGRIDSGAFILAGPVADRHSWYARHRYVVTGGACRCAQRGHPCPDTERLYGPACEETKCGHITCERIHGRRVCPDFLAWIDHADDERHPLWVLGTWEMLVAEHLDQTRADRVTVSAAADYLDGHLTALARADDFAFDQLAREVIGCLTYVETTLAVAEHTETGAPCPVCHAAGRAAKPLECRYDDSDLSGESDEWVCPTRACGQTWTRVEYDRYVEREHASRAARLTASQIAETYRIPEGTLRRWAAEERVKRLGKDRFGRQLYDVAQALAARDTQGSTAPAASA